MIAKHSLFYAIMIILVVGAIEVLNGIGWRILVSEARRAAKGVDISRSSLAEPHVGFLLLPNHCKEYRYGMHDPNNSYKPGVPDWRLCTNSLGWRSPEFSVEKPPMTFRVVCIGDSSTMGQGVRPEDTYCHLFGKRLEPLIAEYGLKVEIIDAGVWGYSSYQGLIIYEMFVSHWQPDLVTVAYGTNDRQLVAKSNQHYRDRLLYSRPGKGRESIRMPVSQSSSNTVKVIQYAVQLFREWREGRYLLSDRRSTPMEYYDNIATLLDKVRASGAMTVVLGIAIPEKEYREILARVSTSRSVPYVPTWDALAAVEPLVKADQLYQKDKDEIEQWLTEDGLKSIGIYSRYLTIDGGHPSKIGHKIIADALYNAATPGIKARMQGDKKH